VLSLHPSPELPPRIEPPEEIRLTEDLVRWLRDYFLACEAALAAVNPAVVGSAPDWCRDLRGDLETRLIQQTHLLLSLHLPLAEPPGFRQLLADIFGEGFFLAYRDIADCRGRVVPAFPDGARCIHGHFLAETLRERFPDARLITWVRDPVRRVAAQYHYWRRAPDWSHPVCRAMHGQQWSLVEFARQDAMRDRMSHYFGRLRPADFAFIGVLESLPRSVDLLRRMLQLTAVPRAKAYRPEAPLEEVPGMSSAEAAEIARLNGQDGQLYAECCAWFERTGRECHL
jgi:hypothetical protein